MAAVLLGVLVLGAVVLVPERAPGLRHDSVLDVLFDDRWVVGGTRTLGLAVALYLLASISVRVVRGQWLRQLGTADVETDRSIREVASDQGELQDALDQANATIDGLRREYADLLAAQRGSDEDGAASR